MSGSILTISDITIKQDSFGRFCLNDLHKAAGSERRHELTNWTALQQTKDLIAELTSEITTTGIPVVEQNQPLVVINGGKNRGSYGVKELVYAYATWISAKFFLRVIRAYDAMVNQKTTQYGLKELPLTTLTPAMQRQVQKAIGHLVKTQVGTTYSSLYGQIKDKFSVGSYKDVSIKRYGELCEFLNIEPIEGELVEPVKLEYQPPAGMVLIDVNELEKLKQSNNCNTELTYSEWIDVINQMEACNFKIVERGLLVELKNLLTKIV